MSWHVKDDLSLLEIDCLPVTTVWNYLTIIIDVFLLKTIVFFLDLQVQEHSWLESSYRNHEKSSHAIDIGILPSNSISHGQLQPINYWSKCSMHLNRNNIRNVIKIFYF